MVMELSEEQKVIRQTALEFAEKELAPYEDDMEANDGLPKDVERKICQKAKEVGLTSMAMPEEYGGAGFDTIAQVIVMEAMATKVSAPLVALIPQPSSILLGCNEEQVQRYLIPSINLEKEECFALTEPEAGSDASSIKTHAEKKGDKWVLNGTKRFISHGDTADFAIVIAITDPETRSATSFLVDKGTPGFRVGQIHDTMGYRGYRQAELIFEDCEVPEENVLGEVNKGWEMTAKKWLRNGRIITASMSLGMAARAIKLTRDYATQRVQFGQPIADFQAIQFMLAECATELYAARWMTYKAAYDEVYTDDGRAINEKAAMCKYFASEMLGHVVDKCLQIHGGMGYMKESTIEHIYRDARIERIWEGTSQIQLRIIGNGLRKRGILHF